jgi:ABC-2 type transport system permease protein
MTLAMCLNYGLQLWIDGILGARIRTGQVATDLLKPMDFQWLYFASTLSDVAVQCGIASVVLGLAWGFLEHPPLILDLPHLAVFVLSVGLGILVAYGATFLVALSCFITHNGYGAFYIRLMSHLAFSGVFAPLSLYPPALRTVAAYLPFHCVIYTPVALVQGLEPLNAAPGLMLEQAAWAAGLLLLGQVAYRRIMGNLSVQGG